MSQNSLRQSNFRSDFGFLLLLLIVWKRRCLLSDATTWQLSCRLSAAWWWWQAQVAGPSSNPANRKIYTKLVNYLVRKQQWISYIVQIKKSTVSFVGWAILQFHFWQIVWSILPGFYYQELKGLWLLNHIWTLQLVPIDRDSLGSVWLDWIAASGSTTLKTEF